MKFFKSVFLIFFSFLIVATKSRWQKYNKNKSPQLHCQCNDKNNDEVTTQRSVIPFRDADDEISQDPCEPYNPPVPDFMKPGRRISDAKCEEYQWMMKVRKENAERDKECKNKGLLIKINPVEMLQAEREKRQTDINDTLSEELQDAAGSNDYHEMTLYVMGGRDASPMEFPHMGAIGWKSVDEDLKWKFMCGSTLISPNYVLTAGHCTKADSRDTTITDPVPKVVRFGVESLILTNINNPPIDRTISEILQHPQYVSPKKYFDLALMKLEMPITFNKYVQPACLWTGGLELVKKATVTGWGVTNLTSRIGHSYLQVADLNLIDSGLCDELLKPSCSRLWCGIQDHQFCAGQLDGGVDSCSGDSGGPLQTKIALPAKLKSEGNMHYVIGLVSFGIGCGKKDLPGVYTKASYFLDWIESIVWTQEKLV